MIIAIPNYDEMGEFLSEIAEDRSEDCIQLRTLPDGSKKDGAYCTMDQKFTQVRGFSRNILKPMMEKTLTEEQGVFISTVSMDKTFAERKCRLPRTVSNADSNKQRRKNCIDPLAIVADYDYGTKARIKDPVIELDLPTPTVRVQSGSGQQFWWFLERDSCVTEQRNKICWEIAKVTGGNEQVKRHTRLLRLPGSINSKDPKNPKPVYIIEKNYDLRYCLADFEFLLVTNLRLNSSKNSIF